MKIDIFSHIMPPRYLAALEKKIPPEVVKHLPSKMLPALGDLNLRFKVMDHDPDVVEVLTVANRRWKPCFRPPTRWNYRGWSTTRWQNWWPSIRGASSVPWPACDERR